MQEMATAAVVPDLRAIMAYQHLGVVKKLQLELDLSEDEAQLLFEDTKRFLYLATTEEGSVRPTGPIDVGWHAFLLFTRDYQEFCKTHFGRFLHHSPILGGDSGERDAGVNRTIRAARQMFGDEISKNWSFSGAECAPDTNCEAPPSDCALN